MAKKEAVKKEATTVTEASNSNGVAKFVDETKGELGKVVWPSRQQLLSESAAVLSMVVLVSLVIYLVDNLFVWGAGKVF